MRKFTVFILIAAMLLASVAGCTKYKNGQNKLTYDEAITELNALMKKVELSTVSSPVLDVYSDDLTEADALSDISVFPSDLREKASSLFAPRSATITKNELIAAVTERIMKELST